MTPMVALSRRLGFDPVGWSDFEWWLDQDRQASKKVRALIREVLRTPFDGTGQPERLKYQVGANVWSRRITQEHRLVYMVTDDAIIVLQARHHY